MTRSHDPLRLSRLEVLGAWLHIWTPHRDAEIPPIPWRSIGIWTAVSAVVLGIAAALIVPRIDESKREGAARDARSIAAIRAANRARIVAEQRPHNGSMARPAHFARLPDAQQVAARTALYQDAQAKILADARARAATHALQGPIRGIACETTPPGGTTLPHPESDPGKARAAWDCVAITDKIPRSAISVAGSIGYPFRLKIDFARFSYVWCKVNPIAGERSVPDPSLVVPLPPVCRVAS